MSASRVASIGMHLGERPDVALGMLDAVLQAVRAFVVEHPEMLEGRGEFAVVFGPREEIKAALCSTA